MSDLIVLIVLITIFIFSMLKYFEPRFEIVKSASKYKIYLWYNEWEERDYKRVYKFLFEL